MYDLVLKNCNVINENVESQVDIAIKKQRIEKIAATIDSESSEELLRADLLRKGASSHPRRHVAHPRYQQ